MQGNLSQRTCVYIAKLPLPAFSLCNPIVRNNCANNPNPLHIVPQAISNDLQVRADDMMKGL